jgi:hypothetical protein
MRGPQYAITAYADRRVHHRDERNGHAGDRRHADSATIDSDPYPNANPNATIRSEVGVKGGLARKNRTW